MKNSIKIVIVAAVLVLALASGALAGGQATSTWNGDVQCKRYGADGFVCVETDTYWGLAISSDVIVVTNARNRVMYSKNLP